MRLRHRLHGVGVINLNDLANALKPIVLPGENLEVRIVKFGEEAGQGVPLVFVHEFAGDARSWHLQARHFARRYRTIAFNARGYPPSDVPEDPGLYSQDHAVEDIRGLLDALGIERAHVCGLSMGGYATLLFGLRHAVPRGHERPTGLRFAGHPPASTPWSPAA